MKIVLNQAQWDELNVANEELFVRAAFFLGFNYMYIQNRCTGNSHERERQSVVQTAVDMGMENSDVIIKGIPKCY